MHSEGRVVVDEVDVDLRDALKEDVYFFKLHEVDAENYVSNEGHHVQREYIKLPDGLELRGQWVYRDPSGNIIDFDYFMSDLFERNNLRVVDIIFSMG